MIARLPNFAEHHFAALCSAAGVVCNRSTEDECGWDFLIEFLSPNDPGLPADMQAPNIEAYVQVKSTKTPPYSARLKLSNALRAARSSQPHFLVLVAIDESTGEQRIYARHFWEDEIARSLRRARLAESKARTAFHHQTLNLLMRDADDHTSDLLAWMSETIRSIKPSYAERKLAITGNVGFDAHGGMTFTFSTQAGPSDFVDWQLGLIDELSVQNVECRTERFGVSLPLPGQSIDKATIRVEARGEPCVLKLQGGSPTDELLLAATLYHTSVPGLPNSAQRWRVDAGPLRLLGGDSRYSAHLSLNPQEPKSLKELAEFLQIASWQGAGTIGAQLFVNSMKIPFGSIELEAGLPDGLDEMRKDVLSKRQVADADPACDALLSIQQINASAYMIGRFLGFVNSPTLRIEYEPEDQDDPVRAAIYYTYCVVGDCCLLAVIERSTRTDSTHGPKRRLDFSEPRILDAVVRQGRLDDHKLEIEKSCSEQVERLGDPRTLWEIGDIEDFVSKHSSARDAKDAA